MPKTYIVGSGSTTIAMQRVRCTDECAELQAMLEKNPELLGGEQMNPDEPRRWLLVKREMPVQDPSSGADRWNVDFFFLDQAGIPTFVECKRFADTRSRREVVGQMLEYAANGPSYWTRERIRGFAEQAASSQGSTLDAELQKLRPDDDRSIEEYFELVENNLREGQIRLVFFLDEAPQELKSIVDFLNKQMERSEVLLVEATQYSDGKITVVVPALFGFTEQARMVKKTVTVAAAAGRKRWDENSFFEDAKARLSSGQYAAVRGLYDGCLTHGYEVRWGTGAKTGSFSAVLAAVFQKSVISVYSDGRLILNFGWLRDNELAQAYRDELARYARDVLRWSIPADFAEKYVTIAVTSWGANLDDLNQALADLASRFSAKAT